MKKVAESKKIEVQKLVKLMLDYPIVGVVNMENLPAKQLQKMRDKLRGKVLIRMSKQRLIKIALEEAKKQRKDLEKLTPHLKGMPALLFTKESPFKLSKILKENKSKAPAKAGQTAPEDIVIPAGPTQFAPGPIISELSAIGLKTGVEGGKVSVREAKTVIKAGEKFTQKMGEVFTKLGIMPMQIGLDLTAAFENGTIYTKDVLSIDEAQVLIDLQLAAQNAIALSVEIEYPTKDNIKRLIAKTYNQAKHISLKYNIMSDALAEKMIQDAAMQVKTLAKQANIPEE